VSPANVKGHAMFKESSQGREVAFEADCQGTHAVPVETETPYDILDAKEQAESEDGKDIYQAASGPRKFEWGRLVQWPATFLAGVVNTKSAKLSPKVIRALALRALLLISIQDRELHGADIGRLLDIAPATVTQHGNVLISQLGSTAILPGKRSQQTRLHCRQARKRRLK